MFERQIARRHAPHDHAAYSYRWRRALLSSWQTDVGDRAHSTASPTPTPDPSINS